MANFSEKEHVSGAGRERGSGKSGEWERSGEWEAAERSGVESGCHKNRLKR